MQVSLTPKLDEYVREKIESGLYNSASEVVSDALRLMQEHEALRKAKLERLSEEVRKGELDAATGRGTTIENDEELDAFFERL